MKKKYIKIEPSIFAADFGHFADEAKRSEDAGADALHVDIMDGHFVPNLSLGPKHVGALKRATPNLFLDVHIMVYNPFDYVERLVEMGADSITFHIEATEDVEDTLAYIRKCKLKAGLAFCPETTESIVPKYLGKCDLMLFMTVHPGFGGQAFMPEVLPKIRFARETCDRLRIREGGKTEDPEKPENLPPFDIQVDGGITLETAQQCLDAGANRFVSGTYLFHASDMAKRIEAMRNLGT